MSLTGCCLTLPNEIIEDIRQEIPGNTAPDTEAPAESIPAVEFPDVTQGIYFPLLENIGNSPLVETAEKDDGSVYFVYSNATEAELNQFITFCGYCGLYRTTQERDGLTIHYLMRPGTNFIALAYLKDNNL